MNTPDPSPTRRLVYALLITVAAGALAGRILSTELVFDPTVYKQKHELRKAGRPWPAERPLPMPTFGSNDRSRWATVRNLVDKGTYVIGQRDRNVVLGSGTFTLAATDPLQAVALARASFVLHTQADSGLIFQDGWQTVDKVLHPAEQNYYSSKPPLLATLVAGLYWLLKALFGWTLDKDPFAVVRTILMVINWLPFLIYLGLLSRLVDRYGRTDWGRWYVVTAAAFGTLVSLFGVTLNNHTIGTWSVLFAVYPLLRIWEGRQSALASGSRLNEGSYFALAGFFAMFAACNELPAAAFGVAVFLILARWDWWRTLVFFTPAALVPLAAFLLTNYAAVGMLRPAYSEFGGPWYQYEGSHWLPVLPTKEKASGIDWAHLEESRAEYAFHVLAGHHGLFSLTPIWLLAFAGAGAGLVWGWRRRTRQESVMAEPESAGVPFFVYPLTLLLSLVVIGFYLYKSDNYGGWTNGLRWLMWLTPLWLLCLLPVADKLSACRKGRTLGYVLLAFSVLSVNSMSWNPWRHPWLYQLMRALGWEGY